ncbi:hypothetical protein [Pusillimonas noertemannii]|uniref:hypothetical protein n=1 Tax=Pusillimonas noertemannii TaxID=305977 RepID=UPI0002D8ABB8|nr:hypothetical protein [Pusillimonas noertemannii]
MERQETLSNPVFNRKEARQPEPSAQTATSPAATSSAKLAGFCERLYAVRSSPQYSRYLETIASL